MRTEKETKTWALCPECGGRVGTVDHLAVGSSAGPWFCEDCGCGWWLTVTVDGVDHRPHDYVRRRTVVKLVLPPKALPVVLTVDGVHIVKNGDPSPDGDGDEYFYNEHTCPTNWMGKVTKIEFDGDDDPHGLFRWESTRPRAAEDDDEVS